MTATDAFSDNAYLPGTRRWRAADLSVLVLVIVALVCAVVLRQLNVNATQTASFEGVVFEIPKRAIVESATDTFVATVPGMTLRAVKLPAPAGEESGSLAASRALQQAQSRALFQVSHTQGVQVAGQEAELLSYQYIEKSSRVFATGLRVIVGNEVLVPEPDGDSFYAIALEGPSDRRSELDAMWPKIQTSVRLGG